MDAGTSPSIAMYVVSTYYATETSPEKEVEITQIKIMAIKVPSVYLPYRGSYVHRYFFFNFL